MTLTDLLSLLAIVLAPFSVVSAVILVYYARKPPRMGLLDERTWIAAVIALMVVSGAAITLNRISGYGLFPVEAARLLFTASLVLLAFVPVVWLVLLATGRLGEGER